MNKQHLKGLIEKSEKGYRVVASTAAVDRQGDVIDQGGWELGNFLKNPVMLWAHNYSALPVAKVLNLAINTLGLVAEYEFAPAEGNPMAQQIKALVDGGFINAVSVGFIPKERSGNTITKSELLEISFVPVPANQEALVLAAKALTDSGTPESEAASVVAKFLQLKTEEVAKGPVADDLAAQQAMEQKWENCDSVFDVINAFLDVYLSPDTAVEDFAKLLTEAIGLLSKVAGGDTEPQVAALREQLVSKIADSAKTGGLKSLALKVGARHSKATKEALSKALESIGAGADLIKGIVEAKEEEEAVEAEPEAKTEVVEVPVVNGEAELRALLVVRGILGNKENSSRHALSAVNALIDARR